MWLEKRKGRYFAAWRAKGEGIRRKALYTDKKASAAKLADLIRRQERGDADLLDPFEDHRDRPLMEHVEAWIEHLTESGKSESYIRLCRGRMTRLVTDCEWKRLADIRAEGFEDWRVRAKVVPSGFVAGKKVKEQTLSPRGKNHYFECLRSFCRWCVRKGRMAENPVARVERLPEAGTARRARRALTPDELARLLAVIPDEHRLVYLAAAFTGLRRAELEALEWGDVHLDTPRPFIQLRAETTKARRGDTVPVRADLAEALRQARGEAEDGERVFACVPDIKRHKTWLAKADIDWEDDRGRRADFHALRTTLATMLNRAGVSVQAAMAIMRHTDIRLTTRTYSDLRLFDTAAAVETLPSILVGDQTDSEAGRRTGTDDQPEAGVAQGVARATPEGQKSARIGAIGGEVQTGDWSGYTGENARFGADRHGSKNTAMGGTRTLTPFGTGT